MYIQADSFKDRSTMLLLPARGPAAHWAVVSAVMSLAFPQNARQGHRIMGGAEVGQAYNALFKLALDSGMTYALTVEDDMLPPPDALTRLLAQLEGHPEYSAVSALYWTKGLNSFPLVLGHPEHGDYLPRRGCEGLTEVNAIPMGCALWRLDTFPSLPAPWFMTPPDCTQDIYFARKAREAGHRFAVDCSLRVGHLDVTTGTVY